MGLGLGPRFFMMEKSIDDLCGPAKNFLRKICATVEPVHVDETLAKQDCQMKEETVKKVQAAVEDLVSELLHYGRKEDEELSRAALEWGIQKGWIRQEQVVTWFVEELLKQWPVRNVTKDSSKETGHMTF